MTKTNPNDDIVYILNDYINIGIKGLEYVLIYG